MDKKEILSQAGQLLMDKVRDRVLKVNDLIMEGNMGSDENQNLYKSIETLDIRIQEIIKSFVIKSVDSTLHHFLWMIEQYEEYDLIQYTMEDKSQFVSLRDISDGLCGELYTEDGWIEKYSKYPPSIK